MKPTPPSLTVRLAGLFALSSSLLLAALGAAIYVASDRHFVEQDAHDLHGRAQTVSQLIGRYPLPALAEAIDALVVSQHELAILLQDEQGHAIYARSPEVFADDRAPPLNAPAASPALPSDHPFALRTLEHQGQVWRTITLPYSGPGPVRQIRLAIGIDHHQDFLHSLLRWLLIGGSAAALLGAGLGVWIARRGLAPLQQISRRATLISAERLSERLDEAGLPRELLPLVRELNAMLTRLDEAFRRLTDFSSDLAHELRTPISNLLTQTEVALTRARSDEEYREVLSSNLEEFGRLSRMIADMLFLARADHGLTVPQRCPVDLAEQADALLSFYEALADERRLRLTRSGTATVSGDPLMLRRALSNLLSNAIRHADPESTVSLVLATGADGVRIDLCNRGPSIAAHHLPRLFDRFYRGDFARQRDGAAGDEGTGLGLGIVKSIVDAHGGRITVTSAEGETRFSIHLP
jgi:two-component system, OmpR family, heavy metal sensor histidine kinase CusS